MRVPKDIGGRELASLLVRYGYKVTRQTGSHMRLTTSINGEHHITIPEHKPLRIGTLNSILNDISAHLEIDKKSFIKELFEMR
ncbi:MAG: type II toxin-antitoxin system HicA family toxin [Actinomycetota bacterium]